MNSAIQLIPNGTNRTPEIVELLRRLPDNSTVSFEKGVYDFFADGAYEGYFSPSCNTSSDKKVIFPLLSVKNVTIDGGGSTFLFHDRVFPFISQFSDGVILRNFTVDFSFPRYINAETVEKTDTFLRVRILDEDIAYAANDAGNLCIRVGEEELATCERRFFLQEYGGGNCFLVAGKYYYDNKNLPAPIFRCDAVKEGDTLVFRFNGDTAHIPAFRPGVRLAISYDENRMNDVIFLDRSRNITVQDVTIHRGAGMGIVGNCCENLTAERFVIEPSPARDDLYSTTADGMLLTNFTGVIKVTDSKIRHTMDDAMSIHGFYTKVERITAPDKLTVRLVHPSQSGTMLYFPGDEITFSTGDTMCETTSAVVKSAYFARDPDLIYLTFEAPIDTAVSVGDWLENKGRMPEVILRNNLFDTFPALRLGNPKKTVVEKNHIRNGRLLVNDLLGYWCASGCVHDLTIRGNTFENAGIAVMQTRDSRTTAFHSDIVVENNTFCNCSRSLTADHTERLRFTDNILENSGEPQFDTTCREIATETKGE